MLVEFAAADAVRDLRDANAPATKSGFGTANSVATAEKLLQRMVLGADDDDSSWATMGTAAAATTTSRRLTYSSEDDSSVETRHARKKKAKARAKDDRDRRGARRTDQHDDRRDRRPRREGRDRSKARDHPKGRESYKDNPCPHCRKYKRYAQHPNVPDAKCFYNTKFKGWRPEKVCETLGINFRSKSRFRDVDESSGVDTSDSE